jgi:hypothetical protein
VKIQVGATEEQHQATIHGVKWLSNGSGFGRSPNSGWRNFQSHGISEQFSLQMPFNPDPQQAGNTVDYLYAVDATRDGIWSGTWGPAQIRQQRQDLFMLPDSPVGNFTVVNANQFSGSARTPRSAGSTMSPRCSPTTCCRTTSGSRFRSSRTSTRSSRPPPSGSRPSAVRWIRSAARWSTTGAARSCRTSPYPPKTAHPPSRPEAARVRSTTRPPSCTCAPRTWCSTTCVDPNPSSVLEMPHDARNLVDLLPGTPVEPLVLRANAGDCINVTLRNALPFTPVDVIDQDPLSPTFGRVIGVNQVPDPMPDLAGWQDVFWVANRDRSTRCVRPRCASSTTT